MLANEQHEFLKRHLYIDGDGNVISNDDTMCVIEQNAVECVVQIGEQRSTVNVEDLRRVLNIENSQTGVIGDCNYVEGGIHQHRHEHHHYPAKHSLPHNSDNPILDINTLRDAVSACGALLRQHKHTIANTGKHIPREVVQEIVAWAQEPPEEHHVAMLLDQAGMGKTVVMRDVLCALESLGMVVLAIKADLQLSGLTQYEDLPNQLHLPDSVEYIVKQLAAMAPVVVLLDQIDALSLSLSRDQKTLNIAIDLLARLRTIPGVCILFSCRKFDYDNDPKLNSIEVKKRFSIPELSNAEIASILQEVNVHFEALAPETQQLLRTPLHLELFMRVLESDPELEGNVYDINSLQALYRHLWRNVILKSGSNIPIKSEREAALWVLTDAMNRNRTTTVSQSVFMRPANQYLQPAVRWLASAGILIEDKTHWSFLHQTFFDYCYARHFVENERSLSKTILESDQGLFARSQLHQVIAYLREVRPNTYLRELNMLLTAPNLRFHLRDLLLRWFGALSNPTDREWTIAYRMLLNLVQRPQLLQVIRGNPAWFARLDGKPIQTLLAQDDHTLDEQIVPYLVSLIDIIQSGVIRIISPYLGHSDQWNRRLAQLLLNIRSWNTVDAVELLERLMRKMPDLNLKHFFKLSDIVRVYPHPGCRIIRLAFDRVLENYAHKRETETLDPSSVVSFAHELDSIHDSNVESALDIASCVAPYYFVKTMLPWLDSALRLICYPWGDRFNYNYDSLASHWYDDVYIIRRTFIQSFITALTTIAQARPDEFRQIASHLTSLPGQTPQLFLAHVYRRLPQLYAEDAWHFLLADQRRLNLGDFQQYESQQLIRAIVPYLSVSQRADLEAAIFATFTGIWKPRNLKGLRLRGLKQLYLFQAIPVDLLTERGRHTLGELERKFPGERVSHYPRTIEGGVIGSPISSDFARKMSDRDWLHAFQKYQRGIRHKEFLKGGAQELSGVLTELIKETPERFYLLLEQIPDTVDSHYVRAYLNGLAESDAPVAWLFEVVRRFAGQSGRDLKQTVAWALGKRAKEQFPDDIVALLVGYVQEPKGADEVWWERERDHLAIGYLNSERGSALETLMRVFRQRGDIERQWSLIEYVTQDSSAVLRAGAVQELLPMLNVDRERAVTLFEDLLDGYAPLLRDQYVQKFLYYAIHTHFSRLRMFVRVLLEYDDASCKQCGAELACTAAMSPYIDLTEEEREESQALAEEAITGPLACRIGVARVYAVNIGRVPAVVSELSKLLNDEDEQVRNMLNSFLDHLEPDHIFALHEFLEAYAGSRAMYEGVHTFAEYLWENGSLDPRWSLSIVTEILNNPHAPERARWGTGVEKLIRLVLNIYHDPTVPELREEAMDVFDRFMERYAETAQKVLRQWDDR